MMHSLTSWGIYSVYTLVGWAIFEYKFNCLNNMHLPLYSGPPSGVGLFGSVGTMGELYTQYTDGSGYSVYS